MDNKGQETIELISRAEAAQYLNICLSTLDIQRYFLSLRTVLSALIILKSAYLEWLLRLSEL